MADIVLINPGFQPSCWGLEYALPLAGLEGPMPVSALPLLAALTPGEHQVTLLDEYVDEIDFERCARADIVGITGMSVQRGRMVEVLTELKRRNAFTVVGGPWVTVQEDYFKDLADVIFVGEAEDTWPQFLSDWAEGRHKPRYEQAEKTDMTKVPVPRLDLLKMDKYAWGTIQISRGCPFTCEFCDIIVTFGRRPRLKTSAQVIAELDNLLANGKRSAFIVDDNLIGNKKAIVPILKDIVAWQHAHGYRMFLFTEATLDLADEPELLQLMTDASIGAVFVGIETPNEASLRETKKLQNLRNSTGTIQEKVRRIQAAGIEVWSGMVLGFDNDDPGIFDRQLRFVREARIANVMVGMLSAIPKTPLHARLKAAGRLDLSDEPEYGTNVIPLGMSRDALREGYVGVLRDLYDPTAYFDRLDSLYLDGGMTAAGRARYFQNHPLARLRYHTRLLLQAAHLLLGIFRGVSEPHLRREYFSRLRNAIGRRFDPAVLQIYAVRFAMHYHYYRTAAEMRGPRARVLNSY